MTKLPAWMDAYRKRAVAEAASREFFAKVRAESDALARDIMANTAASDFYVSPPRPKPPRPIRSKPPSDIPEIVDARGRAIESVEEYQPRLYATPNYAYGSSEYSGARFYPNTYASQPWAPGEMREMRRGERVTFIATPASSRPSEIVDPQGLPIRAVFVEKSPPRQRGPTLPGQADGTGDGSAVSGKRR